jgi:hypothetical protein
LKRQAIYQTQQVPTESLPIIKKYNDSEHENSIESQRANGIIQLNQFNIFTSAPSKPAPLRNRNAEYGSKYKSPEETIQHLQRQLIQQT